MMKTNPLPKSLGDKNKQKQDIMRKTDPENCGKNYRWGTNCFSFHIWVKNNQPK